MNFLLVFPILASILILSFIGIPESFAQDCKQEHVLIFKISKNTPACVKPTTAEQLMERGWGMMPEQPFSNYSDSCNVEPDPGLCKAAFTKFHFNSETSYCEPFIWGGCGGLVPFDSILDCQTQCETSKVSFEPVYGEVWIIEFNNDGEQLTENELLNSIDSTFAGNVLDFGTTERIPTKYMDEKYEHIEFVNNVKKYKGKKLSEINSEFYILILHNTWEITKHVSIKNLLEDIPIVENVDFYSDWRIPTPKLPKPTGGDQHDVAVIIETWIIQQNASSNILLTTILSDAIDSNESIHMMEVSTIEDISTKYRYAQIPNESDTTHILFLIDWGKSYNHENVKKFLEDIPEVLKADYYAKWHHFQ